MPVAIYRGSLLPETAATLIERAISRVLCVAYQQRLLTAAGDPTCQDIAALRTFPRKKAYDFALRYVESLGRVYRFDEYADGLDDGSSVIIPLDSGGGLGRWLREGPTQAQRTSPNAGIRNTAMQIERWAQQRSGYTLITRVYEGEYDDVALAEIFARKPAFVVVPDGSSREPKSLTPGSYYREFYHFKVWCISQSLRRGPVGLSGSGLPAEFKEDPGLNWIVGAAKRALAGSSLGLLGVASTEIGDEQIVAHDLTNRVFCNSLSLSVCATLHLPDDDIIPFSAVTITSQLPAANDAAHVDLANYVADGCNVPRVDALLSQIFGGVAYINGALVRAIPQTLTFPASSDCYRDLLPNGGFVVQSVPTDAPPPILADPKALRVGMTQTDAGGVTSDRFLCSTLFNLVGPDRIPKE